MTAPEHDPSAEGDIATDRQPVPRPRRVRSRLGPLAVAAGLVLVTLLQNGTHRAGELSTGQAQVIARRTAAIYGLDNAITDSATTLSGKGDFQDLKVTVGQTKDLVNQSVVITWAWGGANPGQHATIRNGTTVQANYLQIFQCWGDLAPDRTQCEFGAYPSLTGTGATSAVTRFIYPPSGPQNGPVDPAESAITKDSRDYLYQGDPNRFAVPFTSVTGELFRHDGNAVNPFYGEFDTNEVPFGITRGDGKGFETLETLTYRESSGLGCADVRRTDPGKGTPRSCWLVVVPRGAQEVNGRAYWELGAAGLQSSPLSASNWADRIVFPLNFSAVGQACPILAKQRLVGGVETSAEAVLRWQPVLCGNGGAVYGYSKLPDAVAEAPLVGDGSATRGLAFLNRPVDPAGVPPDRTLVYAPIAISGVAIAAMVEKVPHSSAASDVQALRGERVSDIKLTPRLVAKLLTQSYGAAVEQNLSRVPGYMKKNPFNIDTDPEFLELNPQFKDLTGSYLQIMLPTGVSSTTQVLWNWIATDEEARDFVAGVPDKWKMRVNPFYQGLQIPQESLPKIDPYCRRDYGQFKLPKLCAFDLHPVVADFHEAARQTSRGDTLALDWPNFTSKPLPTDALYTRMSREVPGSREVLALTDTATAARYELTTVRLRNAAGRFIAPTTASMLAGAAAMRSTGVAGVLAPDPQATATDAYPLTVITYAVAAPNQLTIDAAKDYADFVRYAAGPGQTPGTAPGMLPLGYAPMPAGMRTRALTVAGQIQARVGPKPTNGGTAAGGRTGGGTTGGAPGQTPVPSAAPAPATSPNPVALGQARPSAARTPADAALSFLSRYALIILLTLGLLGLVIGPILPRLAQKLRR